MRTTIILSALLLFAGCGSHGGSNGYFVAQGQVNIPQTTTVVLPTTLTLGITNNGTATFDVVADTADLSVDLGYVSPGQTISFVLPEYPGYVTLSARAVTTDVSGFTPIYTPVTAVEGTDYFPTTDFVGVAWDDSGVPFDMSLVVMARVVYPPVTRK